MTHFDPSFKTGRTVQYSLDVQRELPLNFALSVGYIGNRGTRLRSDFGRLNALPLNALKLGYPLLNTALSDVTAAQRAYATSVGVTLPANNAAVFPGFTGNVAQALRPFPQYRIIRNQLESQGQSWYNAAQVKLDRRFSRGVQFGVSYTFAKLITNASEDLFGGNPYGAALQNPYDRSQLRAVSQNVPPHVVVLSYIFELPFGKGKRFLSQGGWADRIFGGFQVGGIQRYQSGPPLVLRYSNNTEFLQPDTGVGFQGTLRPNLTGRPFFTSATQQGTSFQLVNPAAFTAPPNYRAPPTTDVTSAALAPARVALGKLYVRQNRLAEGAAEFEAATKFAPNLAEAHYQLGRAYQRLKRPAAAARELAEFKRLSDSQREQEQQDLREITRRLANVRF